MITVLDNIQSERRDCIVWMSDLQIGIRLNAEEETKMVDIAGNTYPAGIPVPEDQPVLSLGSTDPSRLANGFYAYTYVYAARDRYPLLDAGKAHQGSIAPRGNPAEFEIIQVTGGPRRVIVQVFGSERLDIDQIILYRTTVWATQEDAELAANAGQMFAIALLDNTLPDQTYNDDNPLVSNTEQVEYDNNFAPTAMVGAYEAPFLWLIGNDPLIKNVSWEGDVVSLDDEGKWFGGRNGMLCTISGITSGGIDGRGTFLFKAGDTDGNNLNNTCILTIDGETPETLAPPTGSGVIRIAGPATSLYRCKPRNPLSWGETIIYGANIRDPKLFARKISGGRATAIAIVPGGEYLKIDTKDPSKAYTFSLRAAGTPAFESTRREISSMSVSHHFSQFVAARQDGQKVLWGWDMDNHAILECDGTTQRIISQPIFETLRNMQTETSRATLVEGFCNQETECNILLMPWGEDINANDLAVYQHYPSQKWGTALVGDLVSSCFIRDPLTNLLRFLGGRNSGVLVEHQRADLTKYHFAETAVITSFTSDTKGINIDLGGFLPEWTDAWAIWYSKHDERIKYGHIESVNLDSGSALTILNFDAIVEIMGGDQSYLQGVEIDTVIEDGILHIGNIPIVIEKILELGKPTQLKTLQSFSLTGNIASPEPTLGVGRLFIYSPNFQSVERLPAPGFNDFYDDITPNQGNWRWNTVGVQEHPQITFRLTFVFFERIQIRSLNLEVK